MPSTIVRITTQLQWSCFFGAENYVAFCDAMKLTVQAETWSELMETIDESVGAVLEDLLKTKELPQFLREHGWNMATPLPENLDEGVHFDVPFSVMIQQQRDQRQHIYQ